MNIADVSGHTRRSFVLSQTAQVCTTRQRDAEILLLFLLGRFVAQTVEYDCAGSATDHGSPHSTPRGLPRTLSES